MRGAARTEALTLAALLLAAACVCSADPARVVSVHDGDSLTVLQGSQKVKVRLSDIDAPELGQHFGRSSRDSLAALCFGLEAQVHASGLDRYGRQIARVECAGRDAAVHQVSAGMAWVFTRYAPTDSHLHALQSQARSSGLGLWAYPSPVPPWDWRRRSK